MSTLTHFDEAGRAAMVDVAGKPETERLAIARGRVVMAPATLALIAEGRALAQARAQRVRDYFVSTGKISPDRLFLARAAATGDTAASVLFEGKGSEVDVYV